MSVDPHNLDAERSVVGAILLAGTVPAGVAATGLTPGHFYRESLGTVYAAALELQDTSAGIDPVSLAARLNGRLEQIGGQAEIDLLASAVPSVGNAAEYARIVVDLAHKRTEVAALHRYREAPHDPDARQTLAAMLAPAAANRDSAIRWLDVAELLDTNPPAVPWLVEGLIARGAVTFLAGQAGIGKSLLALAAASAIAHGAPALAGMAVTAGTVALLDAENGPRLLHQRAHLVDLPRDGVRVGIAAGWTLLNPTGLAELEHQLAPHLPDLLVLDSFPSLASGVEENAVDQIEPILGRLRRFAQAHDVGVLLLHHTRKEGDTYRGGTALAAGADVLAILRRPDDDEPHLLELTWDPRRGGKMRLDAIPDPVYLETTITAGHWTAEAAEPPAGGPASTAPTKRDVLRGQIINILEHHGPMRQSDLLRELGLPTNDRTARRALRELIDEAQITRRQDGHFTRSEEVAGTVPPVPATRGTKGVAEADPVGGPALPPPTHRRRPPGGHSMSRAHDQTTASKAARPLVVSSGDHTSAVPRMALSIGEACEALGVGHDFWQEHVAPEVRIVRRGRRKLVPVDELLGWLTTNAEKAL